MENYPQLREQIASMTFKNVVLNDLKSPWMLFLGIPIFLGVNVYFWFFTDDIEPLLMWLGRIFFILIPIGFLYMNYRYAKSTREHLQKLLDSLPK